MGGVEQRFTEDGRQESPLDVMRTAITAANSGRPYYDGETSAGFRESLLSSLKLDAEEPDGMTFRRSLGGPTGTSISGVLGLVRDIDGLVTTAGEGNTTPMQDSLLTDFAAVASRQIQREGGICSMVADFVDRTPERYFEDPTIKARTSVDFSEDGDGPFLLFPTASFLLPQRDSSRESGEFALFDPVADAVSAEERAIVAALALRILDLLAPTEDDLREGGGWGFLDLSE